MFSEQYHKILCGRFPSWLNEYISLPELQRLAGVGLLCGTDWTALYSNRFFYSRLDHSIGTALIAWNFTHDKKQTLASLFHDIATGCFSHVNDFRKGDALKQEISENATESILKNSSQLCRLLDRDKIQLNEISDYHIYPICDNEIPALSADRLEYMFPSNMALGNLIEGKVWTLEEIKSMYYSIRGLKNEAGIDELGFTDLKMAELYTKGFIDCGHLLQKHENKIALNLLGKIVNLAIEKKVISETDLFEKTEKELISIFDEYALCSEKKSDDFILCSYIKTWRKMRAVLHLDKNPGEGYYTVNLKVKKRYIDPLVQVDGKTLRVSKVSESAASDIKKFLDFQDSAFGAVKLI